MSPFAEFIADAAQRGDMVNIVFEERLFDLVGVLHRVADALTADAIAHELIGGFAVLVHVEEVHPDLSALTRDVDLMVNRSDLDRIRIAAARAGFRYRHAAGVDMLIPEVSHLVRYPVHLIFSGEKVRPTYPTTTPLIAPETKQILGHQVAIISVVDLVCMKLTSFRLKDQVHIQTLDSAGLITPEVEKVLTPELQARLLQVRQSE